MVKTKTFGSAGMTKSDATDGTDAMKEAQLRIVLDSNPATDDYHTWIRGIDDILTYQEAVDMDGTLEYDGYPDYTASDVKKALDSGYVTVYSSYDIRQGTFVTPSRMEAQSYAGSGQVHEKRVKLTEVAWIDSSQGQYTGDVRKRAK